MAVRTPTISLPRIGYGDLKLEFQVKGNWMEAIDLPVRVASSMRKGYDEGVKQFSRRFIEVITRAITTGTPPKGSGVKWDPLSQKTLKRYGFHHPYLLTGLYRNNIKLFKETSRVYIGLSRTKASGGTGNGKSKYTLTQVARILEYGDTEGAGSGIPPRPLWGPTFVSVGGKKRMKQYIVDAIRTRLRQKGIKVRTARYG